MPTYQFRADDGEIVEQFYHMADAPPCGSVVEIEGRKCTRLPPNLGAVRVKDYRHVSLTLPKNCVHAKNHDKRGRVVVESKQEMREIVARVNADPTMPGGYEWEDS